MSTEKEVASVGEPSATSTEEMPQDAAPLNESGEEEEEEEDDDDEEIGQVEGVDQIESMCMSCGEDGITRLLMHKVPHFRELIIASFRCRSCGEHNNEVTFGGEIQLQGCVFTLRVTSPADLDRQLIKSDSASLRLVELDFEIPPKTQKGEISTVEGFLKTAANNLSLHQEQRMEVAPEMGIKVAEVICTLESMARGAVIPFTIVVDDPAGNSFIENPNAPHKDPNMSTKYYFRNEEQDESLGLQHNKGLFRDDGESNFKALMTGEFGAGKAEKKAEEADEEIIEGAVPAAPTENDDGRGEGGVTLGRHETISIPSHCPHCNYLGESLTCVTDIPHFKEVIIMSFDCVNCGFRNNEVKGGGAIPTYGTDVSLNVQDADDMKRDVLKSDTCAVLIPELDLEIMHGSLGGMYTTVEGLLNKIHKNLSEQHSYQSGDGKSNTHSENVQVTGSKNRFKEFLDQLKALSRGENVPFTLKLHDPFGNSFISAPLGTFLAIEDDVRLTVADFQRTHEENEDLGLLDMNTTDFETHDMPDGSTITGAEARDREEAAGVPRQSDRVTTKVTKGADHPSYFAKGCDDATPGGAFVTSPSAVTAPPSSSEAAQQQQQWKAATRGEDGEMLLPPSADDGEPDEDVLAVATRAADADAGLEFRPAESFSGAVPGFVFRRGSQGVGYYADAVPKTETAVAGDASN